MKNREYFLREDLGTFKPKFKILCAEKDLKTENLVQRFGNIENKNYICRVITIKEI